MFVAVIALVLFWIIADAVITDVLPWIKRMR
jgi:hypothetical protein